MLRDSFGLKGTKYGCGVAVYHSYGGWVARMEGATVFAATGKRLRRLPLLRRAPA